MFRIHSKAACLTICLGIILSRAYPVTADEIELQTEDSSEIFQSEDEAEEIVSTTPAPACMDDRTSAEQTESVENDISSSDLTEAVFDDTYEETASVPSEQNSESETSAGSEAVFPDKAGILEDAKLTAELERNKRNLENLGDGGIAVLDHFMEFLVMYPDICETQKIPYAYPLGTDRDVTLTVYQKNGVNYSLVQFSDDSDTDFQCQKFINEMDSEDSVIPEYQIRRGDSQSVQEVGGIVKVSAEYFDTYTEAGISHEGVKAKFATTFYIEGKIMTGGNYDLYTVYGKHWIQPYRSLSMVTSKYSHGIARYWEGDEIVSGTPNTSLKEAVDLNYSISISYPIACSFAFGWTGTAGTKIRAGVDFPMHDVVFTNPNGISGQAADGHFTYDAMTMITIPKRDPMFAFQFNQFFENSVYGNGSYVHSYGGDWRVVVPNMTNSSDSSSEAEENIKYYTDGGIIYNPVFNPTYYLGKYADLQAAFGSNDDAAFRHFLDFGMSEGRQASASFDPAAYRNRYTDLNSAFGDNWKQYYLHYLQHGLSEGRAGN